MWLAFSILRTTFAYALCYLAAVQSEAVVVSLISHYLASTFEAITAGSLGNRDDDDDNNNVTHLHV